MAGLMQKMHKSQAGFNLIELMVAMVIGLLILIAAMGIFASNKQSYRTTQGLGRLQENSQLVFELMSRDIREAGGNPCNVNLNALTKNITNAAVSGNFNPTGSNWYLYWGRPLFGYESPSALGGNTVQANTDAIQVLTTGNDVRVLNTAITGTTDALNFVPGYPQFTANAPVMICDGEVLGIFEAPSSGSSGGSSTDVTVAGSMPISTGNNQSTYIPQPTAAVGGDQELFPINATLSSMAGIRWFVAASTTTPGTTSLFRQVNTTAAEEIAPNVSDMQITYLTPADNLYHTAAEIADTDAEWDAVTAVRIALTFTENQPTGVKGTNAAQNKPITRSIEHVITLRNRVL